MLLSVLSGPVLATCAAAGGAEGGVVSAAGGSFLSSLWPSPLHHRRPAASEHRVSRHPESKHPHLLLLIQLRPLIVLHHQHIHVH